MADKYLAYRRHAMSKFLKFFKEESKLLDVGSHDGVFAELASESGKQAVALDKDPASEGVLEGTAEKIPLKGGQFDGVLFSHVLEHIPVEPGNVRVEKVISEIHRVLKPGGKLVIAVPHPSTFGNKFWDDPTHVRPYNEAAVRSLLDGLFQVEGVFTGVRYFPLLPGLLYSLKLFFLYPIIEPLLGFLPFGFRETIMVARKT